MDRIVRCTVFTIRLTIFIYWIRCDMYYKNYNELLIEYLSSFGRFYHKTHCHIHCRWDGMIQIDYVICILIILKFSLSLVKKVLYYFIYKVSLKLLKLNYISKPGTLFQKKRVLLKKILIPIFPTKRRMGTPNYISMPI